MFHPDQAVDAAHAGLHRSVLLQRARGEGKRSKGSLGAVLVPVLEGGTKERSTSPAMASAPQGPGGAGSRSSW